MNKKRGEMMQNISEQSMLKAFKKNIWDDSVLWALGLGGAFLLAVGFVTSPLLGGLASLIGMLGGASVLGAGAYLFWKLKTKTVFFSKLVQDFVREKERLTQIGRQGLKSELSELGLERAANQLDESIDKLDLFKDSLEIKGISPNELAYAESMEKVWEVFASIMNNLRAIRDTTNSLVHMNESNVRYELKSLSSKRDLNKAQQAQKESYESDLEIIENKKQKIQNLLAENRLGISLINRAIAWVDDFEMVNGEGKVNMRNSLDDLKNHLEGMKELIPSEEEFQNF